MIYLCMGQMINVASGAVGRLLVLSGRERTWLVASFGALVVNIALNIVLIPRFGLEGAAIATLVALTSLSFAGLFLVRRHLSLWPYDRGFMKPVVASLITASVVSVLSRFSPLTGVENLLLLSAASALSFVGVVAMIGLGPEEIGFLRSAFDPAVEHDGSLQDGDSPS